MKSNQNILRFQVPVAYSSNCMHVCQPPKDLQISLVISYKSEIETKHALVMNEQNLLDMCKVSHKGVAYSDADCYSALKLEKLSLGHTPSLC